MHSVTFDSVPMPFEYFLVDSDGGGLLVHLRFPDFSYMQDLVVNISYVEKDKQDWFIHHIATNAHNCLVASTRNAVVRHMKEIREFNKKMGII